MKDFCCRKIVNYILCKEGAHLGHNRPPETINESVIKYILKGYQPFGSPLIDIQENICQAMVKYNEIDNWSYNLSVTCNYKEPDEFTEKESIVEYHVLLKSDKYTFPLIMYMTDRVPLEQHRIICAGIESAFNQLSEIIEYHASKTSY